MLCFKCVFSNVNHEPQQNLIVGVKFFMFVMPEKGDWLWRQWWKSIWTLTVLTMVEVESSNVLDF